MNKILLNNFPYPSQHVVVTNRENLTDQKTFVHGFDGPILVDIIRPRLVSDVLQAILVHDCIAIETFAVSNLVQIFGFADTIKLLKSGCFEIIDGHGFSPVLTRDGSKYVVEFIEHFGTPQEPTTDFNRIERYLKKNYPDCVTEINLLLLQVEAYQKKISFAEAEKILRGEIDYDLKNKNLIAVNAVSSVNSKEILPADIYKILRLLFINKSLFLGNSLDAVALKVDGAAKSLLQQKFSPLVQYGTTHDTISLFQKVLEEKRIPDFSRLYLAGILSIEDVLLFRDNIHGEKFRHWYLTTHYDSEKVHEVLLSKNIPQSILTKWLRFIIPNAIGIANAPVGIVAGAIDSFIIDKIVGGWHPNIFLDDILKSEIDSRLKLHAEKTRRDSIKSRFPNVGRNNPCPCGSGKKFKRCCGEGL